MKPGRVAKCRLHESFPDPGRHDGVDALSDVVGTQTAPPKEPRIAGAERSADHDPISLMLLVAERLTSQLVKPTTMDATMAVPSPPK